MNDGNKRRSSAELIPLFFSAVLLDIIPIHYCHNLYSVMYSVKSVLHFPRSSLRRLRDEAATPREELTTQDGLDKRFTEIHCQVEG